MPMPKGYEERTEALLLAAYLEELDAVSGHDADEPDEDVNVFDEDLNDK
jgi:glutamate dehydrogenase/leucine dehydrogenase